MKTYAQAKATGPSVQHKLDKAIPSAAVQPESVSNVGTPAGRPSGSRHSISRIPIQANGADNLFSSRNGMLGLSEENHTGLPDDLKARIENLSGFSLDEVRVHYNSSKPGQLQALAYTQGTEIHVGPGQEKHLAHEAWHVVQQKQGRVQTTIKAHGMSINDDMALEHEANVMGLKALHTRPNTQMMTGAAIRRREQIPEFLPNANTRLKSGIRGSSKQAPIQGVFFQGTTPKKAEDIEEVVEKWKGTKSSATKSWAVITSPTKAAVEKSDDLGAVGKEELHRFLKKLAEGPNITYESDEKLIALLNKRWATHAQYIKAPKSDSQWRKLNRIAGQMEAKVALLKPPKDFEKIVETARGMTETLAAVVTEQKFGLGLNVLKQSVVLLSEVEKLLTTKGSRFMWHLYSLLSHLGPLSYVYEDFAQKQKQEAASKEAKTQKEVVSL